MFWKRPSAIPPAVIMHLMKGEDLIIILSKVIFDSSKYFFRNLPVIYAYSTPLIVRGGSSSIVCSFGRTILAGSITPSALSPCLINA